MKLLLIQIAFMSLIIAGNLVPVVVGHRHRAEFDGVGRLLDRSLQLVELFTFEHA